MLGSRKWSFAFRKLLDVSIIVGRKKVRRETSCRLGVLRKFLKLIPPRDCSLERKSVRGVLLEGMLKGHDCDKSQQSVMKYYVMPARGLGSGLAGTGFRVDQGEADSSLAVMSSAVACE